MDTITRPSTSLRTGTAPDGIPDPGGPADGQRRTGGRRARSRRPLFRLLVTLLIVGTIGAGAAAAVVTARVASRPDYPGGVAVAGSGEGSAAARGGGRPTAEDGFIADGDSIAVSDLSAPAVAKLDPALREALQRAHDAAEEDGVDLRVGSGWRSKAYQSWLLREAVRTYGSTEEAARWVGTPETSQHVKGEAVDVAPYAAADWLHRHGAEFGLCRTYDNEPWHFELSPSAVEAGCPAMFRDPTEDPRMQG